MPEDADATAGLKKALNIDVAKEVGGHMNYMPGCLDFFPKIASAY